MDGKGKIKIICVVGPTASGKTSLGVGIAKELGGEVVSCDSMQIYKGMDIATAKPQPDEMWGITHHLIDYVEPNESYSVARFCADANKAIDSIVSRNKIPVLVGGTGLYIDSLIDNIMFLDQPTDASLREKLCERANIEGTEALLKELRVIDPLYAEKMHVNDRKRIVRALELYYTSGSTMSEQLERSRRTPSRFSPIMLGIRYNDRQKLYERINRRVDVMIQHGLIDEARAVFNSGASDTSAQAIGHKELAPYFRGEQTLEECVERLKMETRRYAKRQISWFKRDGRIKWIDADGLSADRILDESLRIIAKELST